MDKEVPQEAESDEDESVWARDQQKRDYYYDDSHGYEIYRPEDDDEGVEESESTE